jgi:hypothetical protein
VLPRSSENRPDLGPIVETEAKAGEGRRVDTCTTEQTEKMPPISILLRIQCSPLEILGFLGKFFCCYFAIKCYKMLSFGSICYFLLSFAIFSASAPIQQQQTATALTAVADHLVPSCSAPSCSIICSRQAAFSVATVSSQPSPHSPPETHHSRDAISSVPIGQLQLEEGRMQQLQIAITG